MHEFQLAAANAVANLRDYLSSTAVAFGTSPNAGPSSSIIQQQLGPMFASNLDNVAPNISYAPENVSWFRSLLRDEVSESLPKSLTDNEFLTRLGFLKHGSLTYTGALLFAKRASEAISSATTRVTKYEGDSKTNARTRRNLDGSVIQQIVNARDFIDKHTEHRESISGESSFTETLSQYPMKCVREIIANAICHRDYDDSHRMVYVRVFESTIEVSNPGHWPRLEETGKTVTLNGLVGQPVPRNMNLAKAISSVNLVEMEGSGLQTAISDCRTSGSPEPVVKYADGYVVVTIFPRRNWSRKVSVHLQLDTSESKGVIDDHLAIIRQWSSMIAFSDLPYSKSTKNSYVELSYTSTLSKYKLEFEDPNRITLREICESNESKLILIGPPGSGKTTSCKIFTQHLVEKSETSQKIPVVIRLREIQHALAVPSEQRLFVHVASILGLSFKSNGLSLSPPELSNHNIANLHEIRRAVWKEINSVCSALILDGLDELDMPMQANVIAELEKITPLLPDCVVLLTSRSGTLSHRIEGYSIYETLPMSPLESKAFASKWLGGRKLESFILALESSPISQQAQTSPLFLAHLVAIYQRIGQIPDRPKIIIRKILSLLLEEWDMQRSVKRSSKYSHFETDKKYEFLCSLAYHLVVMVGVSTFSRSDLRKAYSLIRKEFLLPESESNAVIEEIESHTGIVLMVGFDSYQFSHLSFQEYLCAEYIVQMPSLFNLVDSQELPHELAIATSISSNPGMFLSSIVDRWIKANRLDKFPIEKYFRRLVVENMSLGPSNCDLLIKLLILNTKLLNNEGSESGATRAIEDFLHSTALVEEVYSVIRGMSIEDSIVDNDNSVVNNELRNKYFFCRIKNANDLEENAAFLINKQFITKKL